MTIKPGPKTTRKVSRLCSHLLFTTVPRTEVASTSTSTASKGINLFVIGASPFSGSECVCSTGTNRTTMSLSRREAVGPEVRRVTVWQEMSEGEGQMAFGPRNPFTAGATVTEAAMRENSPAGSAPRRPPAASATGRLIVEYHTAFLQASEAQEGNEKDHFPQSGEMARSIKILLRPDSPTGPSFSTARRQRSEDLSHLRKTLNPGIPGLPLNIFRRFRAMACLPRGRLAYRGSIQLKATRPFARSSSPTYTLPRRREPRQPKTAQSREFFAGKIRSAGGTAGWR